MEKLFYPESIAIIGLSSRPNNIPRLVLENLISWCYRGRIFGINPNSSDLHVDGIKMYKEVGELPVVPDLVFILIPAVLCPLPSIHNVPSDKGGAYGLWLRVLF